MQTFLPFKSFDKSMACLDGPRLGKQRSETYILLCRLLKLKGRKKKASKGGGWINHPAARMWKGHEGKLFLYWLANCRAYRDRGYKNKETLLNIKYILKHRRKKLVRTNTDPPWLGKKIMHSSHRSNLLRKDGKYYSQFGWEESDDLEYYWPV